MGSNFDLFTDHKLPLLWLRQQKCEGMLGRWSIQFQEYDFNIHHIKGTDNMLADAVSRQLVCAICCDPVFCDSEWFKHQSADIILQCVVKSLSEGAKPTLAHHF